MHLLKGFIFILLTGTLFSQPGGHVKGRIVDAQTGEALYGANVLAEGTLSGAATDSRGDFLITNLPPGRFNLQITMIGYEKQTVPVSIQPDATQTITAALVPTILKQPALVITATKRRQHIEDAPTTVDIMLSEDIIKRNPSTLDEVLVNTAGLGIIDGQIELRGSTGFNWAAGSRVLLMIDGHPMITGDTGGINWEAIPVEEIERVEIVKGAGSALYGSNAMAGMVNIITKDPGQHPQLRYRLHWGFYDKPAYDNWIWTDRFYDPNFGDNGSIDPRHTLSYEGLDLSYSQKLEKVDFLGTISRSGSSGYHENGDFSRWSSLIKTTWHFTSQKKWSLLANYSRNNHGEFLQWQSQSSPLTVPADELGNRIDYQKAGVLSTFTHVVNCHLAYKIKSNWYRSDWENNFPGNEDYAATDRFGTEIQVDYLRGRHGLTMGTEGIFTITEARIFGNRKSWDAAVYAEDEFRFKPLLTLTCGARVDIHQIPDVLTDWQISPRAGLVYRPVAGTSVRTSIGRGFRAPSLAEVFSTVNVAGVRVVPNLDLKKAEKAVSTELGVNQIFQMTAHTSRFIQWLQPRFIADAAIFANWYQNMIDVDYNESMKAFQFMNLGRARTWGFETKIETSVWTGLLNARIGWTWLNHEDLDTGKPLPYRSDHRLVTGGDIKYRHWTLGLDYRYSGRQKEVVSLFENDERVPMHVMDARLQFTFKKMSIGAEVKNLRNYHYTLRQRFLEPVRHYIISLRGEL